MAKVLVSLKVFPKDAEEDLGALEERIRESLKGKYEVYRVDKEPVAFGLYTLIVHVISPENVEGGTSEVERLIGEVDGVSEVEVVRVSRISF